MKSITDLDSSNARRTTSRTRSAAARLLGGLAAVALAATGLGIQAVEASATPAGRDGKVALVRSNQIYSINADGTGLVKLTSTGRTTARSGRPTGTVWPTSTKPVRVSRTCG
jgi:hypothetical protein